MTASSDFASAKKSLEGQKDAWLGRLCWYSVSESVALPHATLVKHLHACGLTGFIPRVPSDIDKFRKVCTQAQRRKIPTTDPEVFDNFNLRELARDPSNPGRLVRVLVRERVCSDKVQYETELCRITFTAPSRSEETGRLDVACTPGEAVAQTIANGIVKKFNEVRGTLDGYAIRELFRRIVLSGANAVNVRGSGGGVYFASESYGTTLDSLEKLSGLIDGTMVHTLPLIDTAKQRDMVKKAYEAETIEEIERTIEEIAKLRETGKPITQARVVQYMNHLDELRNRTGEYINLLGASQDLAKSSLQLFQRQIASLMNLVG